MRRRIFSALGLTVALTAAVVSAPAATLPDAAGTLGVANTKSLEYTGTGRWFQFGQAPAPTLPWPPFDVSTFTATINYDTASERVQITRLQTVEPGRLRPAPVEQKADQYVAGTTAWNVAIPANSAPGTAPTASVQPAAVAERAAEIWSTPQGFLKAALANKATSRAVGGGVEVSFTVGGKYRYVGTINARNQVERVQTWIATPVLGDTLVETRYSDYKDFGGIQFPAHIVRTEGAFPILDINVATVKLNPAVDIPVPPEIASAKAPTVTVTAQKLADGVYYLTGGTHHSVAIEQGDHVVVVEAPLNEERSLAVIAKVKETFPGKPIKYVVNTHAHFDHSGGLRTYVDEGATIVTHAANKPYYEKVWAAPRTIDPDRLATSKKAARFETFTAKHVLPDAKRAVEIYPVAGSGHNDAFALVYLPAEKILVEADAYTPLAASAPAPAAPNPYTVNLNDNIEKLKLDVAQIAPLHGRLVTLADLRAAIAPPNPGAVAADAAKAAPTAIPYKAKTLARADIDALLAKPEQVLFIDVRRPDELTKIGGFPAYLNIQTDSIEKYLAFIPKDRAIVTVSNHAVRAGKIADLLTDKGFKVAGAAGVQTYEAEGGTLTKVAVPTPRPTTGAPAGQPVAAAPTAVPYKAKTLARADIDALLAKPDQVLFLDIRRPDELTRIGGFPAYLNIQTDSVEKYLAFIPKDRAIVTVSNHAVRAGKIADLLTEKGFKVAGAAGVQTYEAEGGTLTKIAVPTPRPTTGAQAGQPVAAAPAVPSAGAALPDARPKPPLSFFVTSAGPGKGADLGGLAGADKHCQEFAASVGADKKIWHAYLSTQASAGQPAVNARDRIGQGPWYNVRGVAVAKDVADLHGDTLDAARLGNNLSRTTALSEKNEAIKGAGDTPNQHDILTGSQPDGRAFADTADHTCKNFTSSAEEGSTQVGHFDRTGGGNTSWNSAHTSRGCSQEKLAASGGGGLLYCFAIN
jgi:rhodanese-related sulfurtransferase/glyoxylase-like metal-dependent hydrolase (beta-lactamase superfamily II)